MCSQQSSLLCIGRVLTGGSAPLPWSVLACAVSCPPSCFGSVSPCSCDPCQDGIPAAGSRPPVSRLVRPLTPVIKMRPSEVSLLNVSQNCRLPLNPADVLLQVTDYITQLTVTRLTGNDNTNLLLGGEEDGGEGLGCKCVFLLRVAHACLLYSDKRRGLERDFLFERLSSSSSFAPCFHPGNNDGQKPSVRLHHGTFTVPIQQNRTRVLNLR